MTNLTNRMATKLIRRVLDILSTQYGNLKLEVFSNKEACIVTEDSEVALINNELYFNSTIDMLTTLMTPKTIMSFYPSIHTKYIDRIYINFAKQFGSTIEELKINLDLFSNKN